MTNEERRRVPPRRLSCVEMSRRQSPQLRLAARQRNSSAASRRESPANDDNSRANTSPKSSLVCWICPQASRYPVAIHGPLGSERRRTVYRSRGLIGCLESGGFWCQVESAIAWLKKVSATAKEITMGRTFARSQGMQI